MGDARHALAANPIPYAVVHCQRVLVLVVLALLHWQPLIALDPAMNTGTHMPLSCRDPVRVYSITLRSGCDSHSSPAAATAARRQWQHQRKRQCPGRKTRTIVQRMPQKCCVFW